MSINKRLDITFLTSLLVLLMVGYQEEGANAADQELQLPKQEQESKKEMSEKERMEQGQPSFSQLDANHNNSISKKEAQAFKPLTLHFKMLDRNGDNKLNTEEFRAFKTMQMRGFDHGGDSTGEDGEYGERGALKPKPGASTTGQEGQPPKQEQESKKEMSEKERMEKGQPSFSQLDADYNAYISKEEAQAFDPLALHFKMLDRNGDNKLNTQEFRAFKAMQMRGFDHGGDSTGEDGEYGEHGALKPKPGARAADQE